MILFIVLLLFGSKKIPEFARGLGKGIRQFKDATSDIQKDIENSVGDIKKEIKDTKKSIDSSQEKD